MQANRYEEGIPTKLRDDVRNESRKGEINRWLGVNDQSMVFMNSCINDQNFEERIPAIRATRIINGYWVPTWLVGAGLPKYKERCTL